MCGVSYKIYVREVSMSEEKYAAIAGYLSKKFPDCELEQQHDFDRGAQTFKVQIHAKPNTLLLKVSDEFVGDNNTSEILRLIDRWELAKHLCNEKSHGVLITGGGLELFSRD
jgi:hypothetical protein